MEITSPEFENGGFIPPQYTCQGDNVNPELLFSNIPAEAKSLALIMDDPDATHGNFTHWLIWNIDPKKPSIPERYVTNTAVEGLNGRGAAGYTGPCPPSGTHRYFFKLYALNSMLDLPADASKELLETEIREHLIQEAELMGLYKKG